MHQSIRRGLLGTLFAGGLLALGTTAASAADTTSGSDGLLSGTQVNAPVTAPVTLGATSLGLFGDSAAETGGTPGTAAQPAPAPAPGNSTTGSDGLLSGTQVNAPVTAPITLGATSLGLLGDSAAETRGTPGTAGQPAPGNSTSGSDGLLSGTQVNAPVTAPITLGATSLGLLGDSAAETRGTPGTAGQPAPGNSTSGSDGLLSGTQVTAPVTAPIILGAASIGVVGESTAAAANPRAVNQPAVHQPAVAPGAGVVVSGSSMVPAAAPRATTLARTGASTDLLWVAVLFVGAGLIMMAGGLRKKA
ncbi:hypothetical protein NicSoilB4_26470 [Arthrobacter sp. NicSoilB4]|uniref:chaplin family protein n=1 Tax=Arthrobacter sp. NicSoilB4 TaxID=2830997 RepID=UPI001CC44E62|nr:chaplin family protein [Arthrobacter sp. NicSoilB4]BCW67884.1 hypothetical protein NicSoilB4_26470 [Arthrobacter sp. NicSoilB4]